MKSHNLTFITFEPQNSHFKGFLSLEAAISHEGDMEKLLHRGSGLYEKHITNIRHAIKDIQLAKAERKPIAARKIWEIGDIIFKLKFDLAKISLELDGLYDHLVRDLEVKQKWLEKVIIFRRYIPDKKKIPVSLNWGRCEKGTRRIAEGLNKGLLIVDSE